MGIKKTVKRVAKQIQQIVPMVEEIHDHVLLTKHAQATLAEKKREEAQRQRNIEEYDRMAGRANKVNVGGDSVSAHKDPAVNVTNLFPMPADLADIMAFVRAAQWDSRNIAKPESLPDTGDVMDTVHKCLENAGLGPVQRNDVIGQLHNAGLVFRWAGWKTDRLAEPSVKEAHTLSQGLSLGKKRANAYGNMVDAGRVVLMGHANKGGNIYKVQVREWLAYIEGRGCLFEACSDSHTGLVGCQQSRSDNGITIEGDPHTPIKAFTDAKLAHDDLTQQLSEWRAREADRKGETGSDIPASTHNPETGQELAVQVKGPGMIYAGEELAVADRGDASPIGGYYPGTARKIKDNPQA